MPAGSDRRPMASCGLCFAASLLAISIATPTIAQDAAPDSVPSRSSDVPSGIDPGGDRISIGVGLSSTPNYIGSDRSVIMPTAAVQGQVAGIGFNSSGTALYVDAVPGNGKPGWKVQAGPLLAVRLDRHGRINDADVSSLGKRRVAIEPGASLGIQRTGVVTSPYDTLSFGLSYQHDVADAHRSYVMSPEIDYDTPLSAHMLVGLSLSADYVGRRFGDYYYDIDDAGSAASGLPAYAAADRSGWKDWNLGMMTARSLTGTLTHGLGLFVTGGYQRIMGPYRRSPVVSLAGDANQWSGAVGVEYTF